MTDEEQRKYLLKLDELNKLKFAPEVFVKTYKSRNGDYAITKVTTTYVTKLEEPRTKEYNSNYNNSSYNKPKPIDNIEEDVDKFSQQRKQNNSNKFGEVKLE